MLALLLVLAGPAGAQSTSAAGSYRGSVGGETISLELQAGGAALVAGEAGQWSESGGVVEVRDGDGNVYLGKRSAAAIDFTVGGVSVRFERVGVVAKPSAPIYKPAKVLAGTRSKVEGTELSLLLPKGWQGTWEEEKGTEVFVIVSPGNEGRILASARQLSSAEQGKSLSSLLRKWAPQLVKGKSVERARDLTIAGQPGALSIVATRKGKERLHVAVGAIRMESWAILFVGLYPAASTSSMRPVFDTILTSLDGKAPASTRSGDSSSDGSGAKTDATIAHCWRSASSSSSGGGSTTRVQLHLDGSYEWKATSNFGSAGSSGLHEFGTWAVAGRGQIKLTPKGGRDPELYSVAMSGSSLLLNGSKFYRCD